MIIYVDIDNTICVTERTDYSNSKPLPGRIEIINKLFEQGDEIHYWTARGSGSGIDWSELTKNQLNSWGCKYTSLNFGKPVYDLFIDDRNINSETYFS